MTSQISSTLIHDGVTEKQRRLAHDEASARRNEAAKEQFLTVVRDKQRKLDAETLKGLAQIARVGQGIAEARNRHEATTEDQNRDARRRREDSRARRELRFEHLTPGQRRKPKTKDALKFPLWRLFDLIDRRLRQKLRSDPDACDVVVSLQEMQRATGRGARQTRYYRKKLLAIGCVIMNRHSRRKNAAYSIDLTAWNFAD
jgi:hypothetical protein